MTLKKKKGKKTQINHKFHNAVKKQEHLTSSNLLDLLKSTPNEKKETLLQISSFTSLVQFSKSLSTIRVLDVGPL